MVTCSSIAPGVDVAKTMVSIPVLKVDEPMAEKAVALSNNIAVMATARTTIGPSTKLVQDKADAAGKIVTITNSLSPDAFDCFLKGDMKTHDEILRKAGKDLVGKVGVVILAQASMGHLAAELEQIIGVPVLTSPPEAMEALKKAIKE
jgi:Asp/Glu/hydantoin racemase